MQSENYYLLIVAAIDLMPGKVFPETILRYRFDKKLWPMNNNTRFRNNIEVGDYLVFYETACGKMGKGFIATAKAKAKCSKYKYEEPQEWCSTPTQYAIPLTEISLFKQMVPIASIKNSLSFIKNPDTTKWGAYLQGGCIKISEQDYKIITSNVKLLT